MKKGDIVDTLSGSTLIILVMIGLLHVTQGDSTLLVFTRAPEGVMGTECILAVSLERTRSAESQKALQAAEDALRKVEGLMSTHVDDSEIFRFNRAPRGRVVRLSPATMDVLRAARFYASVTGGAFDVTCRPMLQLWRQSARTRSAPGSEDTREARQRSNWPLIALCDDGAVKLAGTASVDLGGIAKGYAIDRAVDAMITAGARGGMVNVGGDMRCFGPSASGEGWEVEVRCPFCQGVLARLKIDAGAVATSGDHFRVFEVGGKRYSHAVDPRHGAPVDAAPSVTVHAPSAMAADAWATALSVLGSEGLDSLPEDAGVSALLVSGTPDEPNLKVSRGFDRLFVVHPNVHKCPGKDSCRPQLHFMAP